MSWVYEKDHMLGQDALVVSVFDDLLTVDSRWIPNAITLADFKRDGWEIYNGTVYKHEEPTHFKFRTTYKKVIRRDRKV